MSDAGELKARATLPVPPVGWEGEPQAQVIDLMAALKASLKKARADDAGAVAQGDGDPGA